MSRALSIRRSSGFPLVALLVPMLALPARPVAAAAPAPLLGHAIEYVIVTRAALAPSFAPLVEWKIRKGVPAAVETLEDIRAEYALAADDAERVRRFLQDARAAGTRWVLIGGDTDVIPIRYARTTFYGGADIPTDRYYECLDGDWNADGDAQYGEGYLSALDPGDQADLAADVFVGRAPVRTAAEAARVVARVIQYERYPAGDYEGSRLFAAEVLLPDPWNPGDPPQLDGALIVEPMLPIFDPVTQPVTRLYENHTDPGWAPGAHPETAAALRDSMNVGYGFVALVGRGNSVLFSAGDDFLTVDDALGLTNSSRPFPMWLSSSCLSQPDVESFGEALLRSPSGGAAALVGPAQIGFPSAERHFFEGFMRVTHDSGEVRMGRAFARAREPFLPYSEFDGVTRWTQMSLILFGDPELTIWMRRPPPLTVAHSPSVTPGQAVVVHVDAGGAPLANARVTLHQPDHVLAILLTDANGQASAVPSGAVDGAIALTVSADDFRPYEATVLFGTVTATTASLVRSEVSSERVTLTWDAPAWRGAEATLERRHAEGGPWAAAGRVESAGEGVIVTTDEQVQSGSRYGYRLARQVNGEPEYSREATIDVPAVTIHRLALGPIAPNPVEPGTRVTLTLAAGGQAQVLLFDLAGRVRWARTMAGAGAGPHVLALEGVDRLPAGLYLLRLSESGQSRSRRLVVR